MSTKPRYSLPPPVVGRKQQDQLQRQQRRANGGKSHGERSEVEESSASSQGSDVSSASRRTPASGSPESGGNTHEESVTVHNENAFALLVGDDEDEDSFVDDPTFEQEIDAAEGEVIVSSETIKIQNAELLQLMFENYTPPSPTSGVRGKKAGVRHGTGRDDVEKERVGDGYSRPRSKEDKKAKRKKHKQRPSSRETSNSTGDRRRGGRPSSREQPSAMIPIAGRREGREHAERHPPHHVEHVGQDCGAPLPSGPATSLVRIFNAVSHRLLLPLVTMECWKMRPCCRKCAL
eukprot:INCI15876.2.p1 GENE.INCI15876.2~~INCI15876.2.p1  ORF type:complete len:291 (+),score=57.04 INCI15876.2:102-974(+)